VGVIQVVALTRIYSEFLQASAIWLVVAAVGWLVAFTPWAARSLWIYATPRVDGQPDESDIAHVSSLH
jgi:uncharacterized protein involved in response to NO